MATLNLTPSEFSDIVVIYLMDHFMNPDKVENKRFEEFVKDNSGRLRPSLMKYYLDSDTKARFRYKRLKKIFEGTDSLAQIRIRPSKEEAEEEAEKESKLKKLGKKVISKLIKREEITKQDINILNEIIKGDENNG